MHAFNFIFYCFYLTDMFYLYTHKGPLPFIEINVLIENCTQIVASALTNIIFLEPNYAYIALGANVCIYVKYNLKITVIAVMQFRCSPPQLREVFVSL